MNKILATLIFALVTVQIEAQMPTNTPKLVVGITVDQLRGDYLKLMQEAFGEEGFNRLIAEGTLYDDVKFDFPNVDRASAMTTLYTGTTPMYHGVIGNYIYNTDLMRVESVLNDPREMGNYTHMTLSPRNILTSTLSDELKVASDGLSTVVAIAPTFEQAIIAGGHAANSVFWIDDENGKWASTTHYKDVPSYVESYNQYNALSKRIDDLYWSPLNPVDSYIHLPYVRSDFAFMQTFDRLKDKKYKAFKTSALVNTEVTSLACQALERGGLGKHDLPDLLNIGYTAATYQGQSVQQAPLETQDTYLRLDQEIATLLRTIDQEVGLEHTVIFLTSTGYTTTEGRAMGTYNIPTGEFYPDRAVALLNVYLMALYGQESWVLGIHDQQIYLNRPLIEERQIDLKEIETKSAEFVIQMTGVHDVTTSHQLLHGNWNNRLDKVRKGFHRHNSGNLIIEVQPGWEIVQEGGYNHDYVRMQAMPTPLILFGKGIKPQHIAVPIQATQVAPTVARILRIRSPNAAAEPPLAEIE